MIAICEHCGNEKPDWAHSCCGEHDFIEICEFCGEEDCICEED